MQDELARFAGDTNQNTQPQEVIEVRTNPAISGTTVTRIPAAELTNQPSPRPATASQIRTLRAIAARQKIDRVGMLREHLGPTTTDEPGIRQATALIDELKNDEGSTPSTNGNGTSQKCCSCDGASSEFVNSFTD